MPTSVNCGRSDQAAERTVKLCPRACIRGEMEMARILTFLYGAVAYILFLGTFVYAMGFVTGLPVPKTIDSGAAGPVPEALIINTLLLALFAVQHSVMARKEFK